MESPSFESLLMVDIQSRAWRSSSIVGLIVEDLWSVSFLTIQRTGFASSSTPSLLFFLNLADLYTHSRYHFCELLFNLLLGYIVKHHSFGANRGFSYSIMELRILFPKEKPFLSIF